MVAVGDPRTVVRGEDHQRIALQPQLFERPEHLADAPVQLHHHVAVKPLFAFALEFVRDGQRHVRHRVGQIEEEGALPVLADELHAPLGVIRGERGLVEVVAQYLVAFVGRQVGELPFGVVGPHVIRVGESVPLVEPVLQRQEFLGVAEVPFSEDRRGVVAFLEHFGDGLLLVADAVWTARIGRVGEADAVGIAPREQSCAGCAADRLCGVEVGVPHPFEGQPVDVRGFVAQGSGEGEVSVSGVVEVNEDEIDVIGSFRLRVARNDPCGGRGRRQNG